MKEQKKLDEATLGFEPASQLPPAKKSAAYVGYATAASIVAGN